MFHKCSVKNIQKYNIHSATLSPWTLPNISFWNFPNLHSPVLVFNIYLSLFHSPENFGREHSKYLFYSLPRFSRALKEHKSLSSRKISSLLSCHLNRMKATVRMKVNFIGNKNKNDIIGCGIRSSLFDPSLNVLKWLPHWSIVHNDCSDCPAIIWPSYWPKCLLSSLYFTNYTVSQICSLIGRPSTSNVFDANSTPMVAEDFILNS